MEKDTLDRCLDRMTRHRPALFRHLRARWVGLFGVKFEVLLYDLTSTYFEEVHVLAESRYRVCKERAMRRRPLKGLWARLKELRDQELQREYCLRVSLATS